MKAMTATAFGTNERQRNNFEESSLLVCLSGLSFRRFFLLLFQMIVHYFLNASFERHFHVCSRVRDTFTHKPNDFMGNFLALT